MRSAGRGVRAIVAQIGFLGDARIGKGLRRVLSTGPRTACSKRVERMTPGEVPLYAKPPGLSEEGALPTARLDAEAAYGDLDDFRITIARRRDGWHIDYEVLDAMRDGGGPPLRHRCRKQQDPGQAA